jgi:hypothetical protein
MRAKGRIVTLPEEPMGVLADEAKTIQKQKQERKIIAAEKRQERYDNAPNRICYAELYAEWKAKHDAGKDPVIPRCNRCRQKLHWEEHHNCPGFIPKYRTDGLSRDERMEKRKAGWDDWDDDQYDPTTPEETSRNLRMDHEAETGETYDQVVIEGMTEEEYLLKKFGYIPSSEDFEE